MSVSAEEFRNALAHFPSGVTVATTIGTDGHPHGITVSAFCSVSLTPPMVLICIEKVTVSHDAFAASGVFVVNVLRESQKEISEQFAAPALDKFEALDFRPGIGGVPVLKDALASIECRLRYSHDGGDHTIYVGNVEEVTVDDGDPLLYFKGDYKRLG